MRVCEETKNPKALEKNASKGVEMERKQTKF